MLKGIGRSVVVVSDIKSDIFEQAIFILSPKGAAGYVNDSDAVVREAREILRDYRVKYYAAKRKRRTISEKRRALAFIGIFAVLILGALIYFF